MNRIARWLKAGMISVFIVLVFAMVIVFAKTGRAAGRVATEGLPNSSACAASAYRQFDFWAGDWDVFDVNSPVKVAHARVDLILDGCVLREDYQGADGHHGQSFTIYDATRKVWHQSWVTNRGELLMIEGNLHDGEMVLSGEDHTKSAMVRGTWKPENGNVRETAVTSTDGGKTWKPWFDLVFRPHATATAAVEDDKRIVPGPDTTYQTAVKENDAASIGRILADDFVLELVS